MIFYQQLVDSKQTGKVPKKPLTILHKLRCVLNGPYHPEVSEAGVELQVDFYLLRKGVSTVCVCGLTLHGLSCLDELRYTCCHMLRVCGQLRLLLGRGLLQHLRTQGAKPVHTDDCKQEAEADATQKMNERAKHTQVVKKKTRRVGFAASQLRVATTFLKQIERFLICTWLQR